MARSRLVWSGRMSPRRAPSRVIRCEHCGAHYDVAVEFDAHYQAVCVRKAVGRVQSIGAPR